MECYRVSVMNEWRQWCACDEHAILDKTKIAICKHFDLRKPRETLPSKQKNTVLIFGICVEPIYIFISNVFILWGKQDLLMVKSKSIPNVSNYLILIWFLYFFCDCTFHFGIFFFLIRRSRHFLLRWIIYVASGEIIKR